MVLFVSDYTFSQDADVFNHYVATTRAKSKLIMVYIKDDPKAKQFGHNIKNMLAGYGLEMRDIAEVIDCSNN